MSLGPCADWSTVRFSQREALAGGRGKQEEGDSSFLSGLGVGQLWEWLGGPTPRLVLLVALDLGMLLALGMPLCPFLL